MSRVKKRLYGKSWVAWWQRWCSRNMIDLDASFDDHELAGAFRAGFRSGWRDRAKADAKKSPPSAGARSPSPAEKK